MNWSPISQTALSPLVFQNIKNKINELRHRRVLIPLTWIKLFQVFPFKFFTIINLFLIWVSFIPLTCPYSTRTRTYVRKYSTCKSALAVVRTREKNVTVKHHTVPLETVIKILRASYKSHGDFSIKYFDYGDVMTAVRQDVTERPGSADCWALQCRGMTSVPPVRTHPLLNWNA